MARSAPNVVSLLRPPQAEEPGVLRLVVNKKPQFYTFQEIPCEIGGRAFAMHRLGMGEVYHVRVGTGTDCSCECLGFLRHGRCKHVMGLRALMENELL